MTPYPIVRELVIGLVVIFISGKDGDERLGQGGKPLCVIDAPDGERDRELEDFVGEGEHLCASEWMGQYLKYRDLRIFWQTTGKT